MGHHTTNRASYRRNGGQAAGGNRHDPNMATVLGLVLNAITAAVLAMGSLRLGGVMLLFAGMFDMVDGALARVRNQKTTFGAFFDSTLDRYSEGIIILGVILYMNSLPPSTEKAWTLALAYLAGWVAGGSYVRDEPRAWAWK